MRDVFCKLAPFVQDYIYNKGWNSLKKIQGEAIEAILETDKHLLISAGTATGKTEAAFFPIVSLISENQYSSISVLYISPLKALINDQFQRLNDLLQEADIPVCKWHGDASSHQKQRLLQQPKGILQITPESLEALLIRRIADIRHLFNSLQFIVIDEVHAMMGEDRGGQLLCQLTKLERFAGCKARRIGLSATLGDCKEAAIWLGQGTGKKTIVLEEHTKREILLAVNWFKKLEQDEKERDIQEVAYYESIYRRCIKGKTIIFTNSRGEAEEIISQMRKLAVARGEQDIFYVHHGNISRLLREEAEDAMKDSERQSVVAATLTLELGIDIGQLEQVLQIGAPFSCSSFMQRLGRSGRRNGHSKMYFTYLEESNERGEMIENIPWELLKIIAIIELSTRNKWIEPINHKRVSFNLLYHQTMSMLGSMGELTAAELARSVLTLPVFQEVSKEEYKCLLSYLLEIDHLQKTEENTLIIGMAGERIINHYSFYGVFKDEEEFKVSFNGRDLGTINSLPPLGINIALAGKAWKVVDVDEEGKQIFVMPIKQTTKKLWRGGGGSVHTKIVQRMKQVLAEDIEYPYLLPSANKRLEEARVLARKMSILDKYVISMSKNVYLILPWVGSREMVTLELVLKMQHVVEELEVIKVAHINSYVVEVHSRLPQNIFEQKLFETIEKVKDIDIAEVKQVVREHNKYDKYLPYKLLKKQYLSENIDLEGLKESVRNSKTAIFVSE